MIVLAVIHLFRGKNPVTSEYQGPIYNLVSAGNVAPSILIYSSHNPESWVMLKGNDWLKITQ